MSSFVKIKRKGKTKIQYKIQPYNKKKYVYTKKERCTMKYKKYEFETYNIYTIKTDKFKNCHVEITFYDNAKKEELGLRNFLASMLCHSSKKYPKRKDLVIKLEELYQSFFYGAASKVGNMVLTNFIYDFINPEYVEDESYLRNVLTFPFEIIEHPNVTEEVFDERSFKIIKKRILADIDAIKENAVNYAFHRALKNLDENSISSASVLGTKEEVENITPENLYAYYRKFYENSLCNIYIIGNLDMDEVVEIIHIKEKSNFAQTNLVVGFNLEKLSKEEMFGTLTFFDEVLCAGGLKSKIYNSLREENGLCYSVSSINSKYDNMYYIYVGLDSKNVSLAVKLIKKCVKEMVQGKITEEEMEMARNQLKTSLEVVVDNQNSLINNYTFHTIVGSPLYKDLKDTYANITCKDLKNVAKKLKINFVYELQGKGEKE